MGRFGLALLAVGCWTILELASGTNGQPSVRTDGLCIDGGRHKIRPSPEGADYAECFNYQQKSCCTADFTKVLAAATVTSIDNFRWDACGAISPQCEDFMIHVECFYRCSPNAANWEGSFPASIAGVPICSSFCDDWYAACRNETSCATNWLFDYNVSASGENSCRSNATCRTWESRYGNAETMCNTLWGASFQYTNNATHCIQLNGTDLVARNDAVARDILPLQDSGTSAPLLSLLSLAVASFAFLL